MGFPALYSLWDYRRKIMLRGRLNRTQIDFLLLNGNIITIDPQNPRAQAVAVAGDRIFAVGSDTDIEGLATFSTRRVNLDGKTVVPGFIDSHSHPAFGGRQHLRSINCDAPDNAEIVHRIRQRSQELGPGEWISGFLYDDTKHDPPLLCEELDSAVPDNPVFVAFRGGHSAMANSAAFRLAGIDEAVTDPPGGRYGRSPETGKLTGRLDDAAREPFYERMKLQYTRDDFREGVALISRMMSRVGITSVADAALHGPDDLRAYLDAWDAGALRFRVYCFINGQYFDSFRDSRIRTGFGNEWVRLGPLKFFSDGSISERTALLSEPYLGAPGDHGLLVAGREALFDPCKKAHAEGWQLAIHANGDVAVEHVLSVYEQLHRENPRPDCRYRIEHCTVTNPSLIARLAALNVIPVPFSCYVTHHGEKMHFYGEERLTRMFAMRSFLDAGLKPSASSDYTASPFDPMLSLQSMVTRTDLSGKTWGANQRISVEEAMRVMTIHGAFASYEEKIKGSIEAGKLADMAVLSDDPFTTHPMELSRIRCERTMLGGQWVYES